MIIITRPQPFADDCVTAFTDAGMQATALPLLHIEKITPTEHANNCAMAIFTSRNAVRFGHHLIQYKQTKLAAIGQGTAQALHEYGLACDIFPEQTPFSSESLLQHATLKQVNNTKIAIITGECSRQHLPDTLKKRGALVKTIVVYRRQPVNYENDKLKRLLQPDATIICTSNSGLQQLAKLIKKADIAAKELQLGVIHSKMIAMAQTLGFTKPPLLANSAQNKDVVWMMKQFQQKNV